VLTHFSLTPIPILPRVLHTRGNLRHVKNPKIIMLIKR
jgi:hypothetical protein